MHNKRPTYSHRPLRLHEGTLLGCVRYTFYTGAFHTAFEAAQRDAERKGRETRQDKLSRLSESNALGLLKHASRTDLNEDGIQMFMEVALGYRQYFPSLPYKTSAKPQRSRLAGFNRPGHRDNGARIEQGRLFRANFNRPA